MGRIVKFAELVHDCILSKQQRNEMNRRYCDAIRSGMKALTAPTCRVANYIRSKPQRNEMNGQYCDDRLSGMNALTAQRFISRVQSHEPR